MIDAHRDPTNPALRNATVRAGGGGAATCLRLGLPAFHELPAKAVGLRWPRAAGSLRAHPIAIGMVVLNRSSGLTHL
jgi:hypothetical protein